MKTRREIHSLDYSLCILMSLLDRVFRGRCEWWDISHGLNIEILDRQEDGSKDVLVHIYPVGWQKDEMIIVRCMNFGYNWWPFEGSVWSARLPDGLGYSFHFQTDDWPLYTLKSNDSRSELFLKESCPGWFENQPS